MADVDEIAAQAVRAAAGAVPKSAGASAAFIVSVLLGGDAPSVEERELVTVVRRRLRSEGPAVRYSVEVERAADGPTRVDVRERVRAVTLTPRDQDVLAFLAIARRLTADQLMALTFPGRHVSIAYRRLAMLATALPGGGGYVRQDFFFGGPGERAKLAAWGLTSEGYRVVAPLLPYLRAYSTAPPAVANLQHDLWLNALFVAMATARGAPVRPGDLPFRWLCDTDRPLAFRTLDADAEFKTNLLRPDAIVELPHATRRIFIEAERGTHTISPSSPTNTGGTTVKARRYGIFVGAPVGLEAATTAYRTAFPDGYRAELLFLVHSEWRRVHVLEALAAARERDANPPDLQLHVMTFEQAREFLTSALPRDGIPARPAVMMPGRRAEVTTRRVRAGDAQALKDGFNVLLEQLKARGGTAILGADARGKIRKTREVIGWIVENASATSKRWSGTERRRADPGGVEPEAR